MTDGALHCEIHGRRLALAACSGCGRGLCRSCRKSRRGTAWCFECVIKGTAPMGSVNRASDRGGPEEPPPSESESGPAGQPQAAEAKDWAATAPESKRPRGPSAPSVVATAPALSESTIAVAASPPRLPRGLYAVLAAQSIAIVLIAGATLRPRSPSPQPAMPTVDLAQVARATPAPVTVFPAPRLTLKDGVVLRGAPVSVRGEAVYGEFVALVIDGKTSGVALVVDRRFELDAANLEAGEHTISVQAYGSRGIAVESAPVYVRYEAAPMAPSPAVASTPNSTLVALPTPVESAPPARENPVAIPGNLPAEAPPVPRSSPSPAPSPAPGASNRGWGASSSSIALTFDGGSSASEADRILTALAREGVFATVFLTGEFIRSYPEVTRRIVAEGHEVGNHTFHHPHLARWDGRRGHVTLPAVTPSFLSEELESTRVAFREVTNQEMKRYWRAPYGEFNDQLGAWAAEEGWRHVGWTQGLDTLDWVADHHDTLYHPADTIRRRIVRRVGRGIEAPGGIVLMHLGSERKDDQMSHQLPALIDDLQRLGCRLVTVSTLLGS